jgi:hypothetical protein
MDECHVATSGPRAAQHDRIETLGDIGSWMCRTSNSPSRNHRLTRRAARGPKLTFAFDPLYASAIEPPDDTT